jgi:hypothetical protein
LLHILKDFRKRVYSFSLWGSQQALELIIVPIHRAKVFTYYCYDLELDYESLSETEREAFKELSFVSSRFSEFRKNIEQHPGVYFTSKELRKKVQETQEKLVSNHFETRMK